MFLFLLVAFALYLAAITVIISVVALLVYDKISIIPLLMSKVDGIYSSLSSLSFVEETPEHGRYRSADGKYQADSVEELITQMAQDPETSLTEEDIDALRKIFEQIIDEEDND